MKKLKVLVLMHEDLVPPETKEGRDEKEIDVWRMEYDVCEALVKLGHKVHQLPVANELAPIRKTIEEWHPHIAFNLLRHFHDVTLYDAHIVSYLELLKTPYTGSNPRGLLLASDKGLCKQLLAYHRVRVPGFAVFPKGGAVRRVGKLNFPVIVKSLVEHASFGIAQASIVNDQEHLRERVGFVHESIGTDAIAEEYIEGREITVSVLGNRRLQVFPPSELLFENLPKGAAPIATQRVKWDREYQKKIGVKSVRPHDLPEQQVKEITRMARRIFRTLNLSGFARLDLRVSPEGRIYLIDANPNPDLSIGEDFAASAAEAGLKYPRLVQRILNLGLCFVPPWKGV